jgi:hypothetical protein
VSGCPLAVDYPAFNLAVFRRDPAAVRCATSDRIRNVYFNNIVFDGGNTATMAIALSAARDVVFDNVTFQNFLDPKDSHLGLVSGSAMLDGIWFRGSRFVGNARWALYLDGAHGSGVIDSQIDNSFGSGGLLFLSNDDFSDDYNRDGRWEPDEVRFANYIVVARNKFGPGGIDTWIHTAIAVKGANSLIEYNNVAGYAYRFALFDSRCSQRWPTLTYQHTGHRVIGNQLGATETLVSVDGTFVPNCAPGSSSEIGQYQVRDNTILGSDQFKQLVLESGQVDGPNLVSGNWLPRAVTAGRPSEAVASPPPDAGNDRR